MILLVLAAIAMIVIILGSLILSIFFTRHGTTPPFFQEKPGWRIASQGIWLLLIIVLVGIPLIISLFVVPHAMNAYALSLLFRNVIGMALLAPTAALLLARGNFDFSAPAVISASGAMLAHFASQGNPSLGILVLVAFSLIVGLVNALVVSLTRLSSVLVTLATGAICMYVGQVITGDMRVELPGGTLHAFEGTMIWWIVAALMAAMVIALAECTPMGRMTKTPAWEETVSQRFLWTGIPLVLMALAACFAGVQRTLWIRIADPYIDINSIFMIKCLAAVVLGGTAFRGRNVAVVGSIIAAIFIAGYEMLANLANLRPGFFILLLAMSLLAFGLLSQQYHNLCAFFFHRRQTQAGPAFPVQMPESASTP